MVCFTVILFCMAALIFPIGFYINEVGGQPYKLPNNTVVGSSYVLFVLSIFFTIVGLLFAGKVCLPGWWMSNLLNSFIIFNFILFFYFWRGEDKGKASEQSSHRKMLRWNWCRKGKKKMLWFVLTMHFGFKNKTNKQTNKESLFHNQIQTILTKSPEHIQAVRSALW